MGGGGKRNGILKPWQLSVHCYLIGASFSKSYSKGFSYEEVSSTLLTTTGDLQMPPTTPANTEAAGLFGCHNKTLSSSRRDIANHRA